MMQLDHYENLEFDGLLPRKVDVWLPPQYTEDSDTRFPVLYMHDGQNLFEPEKAYTGITWGVAEAITKLSTEGVIDPVIVVGIWNTENRVGDYLPKKPFDTWKGELLIKLAKLRRPKFDVKLVADQYLQLLVEVIKPMIDSTYRTKTDAAHTAVMGSSMGGLISLYALCEYPAVFGGAGCVSTHWPIVKPVIRPYLETQLPSPQAHKIYFDHGTIDLDAKYPRLQRKVDSLMRQHGYTERENWLTRVYEGDTHNEACWQARIDVPLTFLFGK